ncbi:helix-turn-helix domain-containing protein [Tenacibaculum aquimarinum]|uniref:helix-turn-helix domain-containing protein n=1 Tax=Tenacibaculum aquimarinum TaxID=2910675 RepID=UPI001F0ABFC5|nr:AraC family transcriptional regulator [Tenacibaculum aquimarinum]MCH3883479.1 AraC family transcriptional regulator [Tenacibaculum aquimarinum]
MLFVLIFFLLFMFFRTYKKNKQSSIKFNKLIASLKENKRLEIDKETITKISKTNNISDEIIESTLIKLTNFETSNKFIKTYSLNSLSKELKTNSTYLSKIINSTKGTNFSNYLNSLRIDYSIKKLQTDKLFRSYTIKAISEEVGFNTSQSFTKAFYKKTGIYPSFFIKSLNENKNNNNRD